MQIFQVWVFSDQHLKDSHREWQVDESVVIDSNAHEVTDQFEVDVGFERLAIEVVELDVLVVAEHTVVGAQQLLHDELEVLFADATFIDAGLATETD